MSVKSQINPPSGISACPEDTADNRRIHSLPYNIIHVDKKHNVQVSPGHSTQVRHIHEYRTEKKDQDPSCNAAEKGLFYRNGNASAFTSSIRPAPMDFPRRMAPALAIPKQTTVPRFSGYHYYRICRYHITSQMPHDHRICREGNAQ